MWCANCHTEATKFYRRPEDNEPVPLCWTCAEAFSWGQVRPNVQLESIDNLEVEIDGDT